MDFSGETALVTGAANGIGLAYVHELLKNGIQTVVLADIDVKNGEIQSEKLNRQYGQNKAIFIKTDITKNDEVRALFEETIKVCKHLNIFINNAGLVDEQRWEHMVDVNLKGSIRCLLLAYQIMGKHNGGKGGTVINVSSAAGLETFPVAPMYSAVKHAIIGLSRSFSHKRHFERTGVKLITICPGGTDTQLMSDLMERNYDNVISDWAKQDFSNYSTQSAESVAVAVMEIIKKGKNGSFWVIRKNKTYEVKIPERRELKRQENIE